MQCPQCQGENRDTAKFCEECGSKLARACPGCGQEVSPRAKFCPECGAGLTASAPSLDLRRTDQRQAWSSDSTAALGRASTQQSVPEAERRQLTVLFCDLVDSTVLAGQLDPEDWREVVRAYQAACAEVIGRYEGHIAQYLGDGLLVYFGYPRAHEDDAQRAVRTGLGMVEAIGQLNAQLRQNSGVRLAVRVGIHTGLVVVGEMGGVGRRESLALGDAPNIAARLQGLAGPNTVVISAATRRLVEAYFTYAELGPQVLKGVATPLAVSQVLGESGVQSRFDAAAPRGFTPLVGREQEVGLLLARWGQVKDGMGQVVVLNGEAGIGKSRLVQVLQERVSGEGATHTTFRCSPYHTNSALYPVIEHLERLLQFRRDDTPQDKVAKLERALGTYRLPQAEAVPLLAALLSLAHPQGYAPLNLSPQRQRQNTHEALVAWLLAEAERQPVLAVWEDLHWADPSTLELLSLVIDQAPTARLLTLLTCRPEFRPPWTTRSYFTQLTLSRLGHSQVEAMITRLTGGKALPGEVVQQIVAKTDGVPLFVEELTKAVLESEVLRETDGLYALTKPLPAFAIPATLQDSLMARLDRLVTAKGLAQLGATLGRQFTYELLQAVAELDDSTLQRELERLVQAELLYQRGLPPGAVYIFKHALIQEIASQSLLKRARQQYHQQIAQVIEERFPEISETQPELLAQHYTEAGVMAQAIPYWRRAGQRAIQHSAYVEAIGHLTKGLEVLKVLPDGPERSQQELGFMTILGLALVATKGQANEEVERTYARAREICRQMGETQQLFLVLWGLLSFYVVRAELQAAWEVGEQLLTLAQRQHDNAYLMVAHWALGQTLLFRGELAPARAHLEQGINRYDPQQYHSLAFLSGFPGDPGVFCLCFAAHTLWHLGYPDQALKRIHEALTLAQELGHPFSHALALDYAAMLHQFRREGHMVQESAAAAMTLCREQGFAYYLAWGTIMQGWALVVQGQSDEGMAQMRHGLAAIRATGAELRQPYYLALLAETCGQTGQAEEGLALLAEALAGAHKHGECWREAELYRLKGELLLQSSVRGPQAEDSISDSRLQTLDSEAEQCFHQSLAVACRQQAKSLELRAAVSLGRLWQEQGKRAEARQLLGDIYGWFTEGFDTADLQEAKALLESLT
jgi:class 3 adenylate cyclase/predicted ATPase